MQQDYTPESFKKGQQFEQFVEQNIFTEQRYELITRTNTYEQNSTRYAEDTLKPDFKFRCKETGQEFWVEAKYRSDFYMDQIEALNYTQRDRFYVLEREEGLPVFVIIGYWGSAYKPYALSLIPLKDYEYLDLYRSFLKKHDLPVGPVSNQRLGLKKPKEQEPEKVFEKKQQENIPEEKKAPAGSNSQELFSPKLMVMAAAGILAILMLIYGFGFSKETPPESPEDNLKEIFRSYYQTMNSNQIEKLPEFLSPRVDQWYSLKSPSHSQVLEIAQNRHGKYPYSTSEINWDSFTVIPQTNGEYLVIYNMAYGFKKKITDNYQFHDLKIITRWDEDFRLKSIREMKD